MAFNTNVGKQQFSATAGQTDFDFNFAIFNDTDLRVYLTPSGNVADDTEDILTLSSDYSVSINGALGGTVELASGASLNDTVTIVRSLPLSRTTDYVTNGDLYADTLDADQDYQTYLAVDQNVRWERSLVLPESYSGEVFTLPAPDPFKMFRWNSTGEYIENIDPTSILDTVNGIIVENVTDLINIDVSVHKTAIVRDINRGGTFIWNSTGTANGGTVFAGTTGYWNRQYSGSVNVKWFGAKGDGITDDTVTLQSVLNSFDNIFIPNTSNTYKVTRLVFKSDSRIHSDGAEVVFSDAASCAEFDGVARTTVENIKFNTQTANTLLMDFKNNSYDLTFNDCTFTGNSSSNTQVGLGFISSYIITFNSCYVTNFAVNVRFGVQANRIVFTGSSIRANQTNNTTLVRVEGGVNNSFLGCDIENCVTWIDNGSISSIEEDSSVNFENCYLESALSYSTLKYGAFNFENCFISEPRFVYYSTTGLVVFLNNTIRKKGSSYIFMSMDATPNDLIIDNNFVNYDIAYPTSTGLFYRGYDGGMQYVNNGNVSSPTWANCALGSGVNISQSRIFDVNTSTIEKQVINTEVSNTLTSGSLTIGGAITASGAIGTAIASAGIFMKDGQWNQGHISFLNSNIHIWIVPTGAGTSQLRIKYGTPTYNTDGVLIATF